MRSEKQLTVEDVQKQLVGLGDEISLIVETRLGFRSRLTISVGEGHLDCILPHIRTKQDLANFLQVREFRLWVDPVDVSISTEWDLQDWIDHFWWGEVMEVYNNGLHPVYADYIDWSIDLRRELPSEPGKLRQVLKLIYALPEFDRVNWVLTARAAEVEFFEWGRGTFFPELKEMLLG